PDSGNVYLEGTEKAAELHQLIGYLPEERGLYRKMTTWEQGLYFGQLKGMKKAECEAALYEWFEKLDMLPWRKKKLEELSKGMQQKVQFVLTVLHRPKLIILDEPFSGFDPLNAETIKKEILGLRDQGSCILLSTHRMDSVEELCDRISLINEGEVVISGELNEVQQQYKKSHYRIVYEGVFPSGVPFECISKTTHAEGKNSAIFQLSNQEEVRQVLNAFLNQTHLLEFREELPSIKDIFIELVGGKA
ncbi:MAG: ATP-binding cassette domain-containing protein, partial [Bacteroidota bacterium]|nr:ATP-binding cassette domain-containing protein [Bacteroidota bacterium]MDX5429688.1 ATP-binding cassette domain-containing protein [Bacteroidota bacterium]MDX5468469.1 ATP-binding cassette domain-containing protein [Bacteroidota bacterium]